MRVFKKGDTVVLQDGGMKRTAKVVADGVDDQNRVRVRPDGIPFDMSISTIKNGTVYVL